MGTREESPFSSPPPGQKQHGTPDFILANVENAAGFGLTSRVMDEIFGQGVDALTSGNHIWDNKEALPLLDEEKRLVRPANSPPLSRGNGSMVIEKRG